MIGMSQIKRKFYTGLGVGLGVGLVVVAIVSIWAAVTINSYQDGTNKKYVQKYTAEVNVLTKDVIQGQTITADMLTKTRVHINMVPLALQTVDTKTGKVNGAILCEPSGMVAKYHIAAGTVVTNDMFGVEIIDQDLRETEINTVLIPTNLVEGEKVDVRIEFPNGTDYTILVNKQVNQIHNDTIWLNLTEEERSLLESANVDAYLNEGTKLYAIEYVDETQTAKEESGIQEIVKGKISDLIKAELSADSFIMVKENSTEKILGIKERIYGVSPDADDETGKKDTKYDFVANTKFSSEEINSVENRLIVLDELLNSLTLTSTEFTDIVTIRDSKSTDEEKVAYLEKTISAKLFKELSSSDMEDLLTILEEQYNNKLSATNVDKMYDFIKSYRNLVACTTSTYQTYQPTNLVKEAMKLNPNITNEAKSKLNDYVRNNIDRLNRDTTTSYGGEDNVQKIIDGAQASIDAQKAERSNVMAAETVE